MTVPGEAKVQEAVPLLFVSEITQSIEFYCEGLGFEMTSKWTD